MSEKDKSHPQIDHIIAWLHVEKSKMENMIISQYQNIKFNEDHLNKINELLNLLKKL